MILKLPRAYASLLLGGTGLVLTLVALSLASVLTHGLTIRGAASWLAATIVVWLVTTVGAISLSGGARSRCGRLGLTGPSGKVSVSLRPTSE